jgi:outer membrane protein, multidrug efflux system
VTQLAVRVGVVVSVAVASVLVAGCITAGPNYARPEMAPPAAFRDAGEQQQPESLADIPWWQVFQDEALQALIRDAIAFNYDLRIAVARVQEARALARVAKSFLYPDIGVGVSSSVNQISRNSQPPLLSEDDDDRVFPNTTINATMSWELDLFGRIRRDSEAAFARYLATEEGRRAVLITLVSDVATAYFQLREFDLQREVALRTLALNDQTVEYYRTRLAGGVSNRLELDSAVANRSLTAASVPDIERQVAILENAISVLAGRPPGAVGRGRTLEEQTLPPDIPVGVPATLLERRPDVVEAEQLLVAANADIGAAKALFYPTISLTGSVGTVSSDLSDLLKGDSVIWSLGAGLFQPLFNAGRIRGNYDAARARFDQALAEYQQTAISAYREVSDSLIAIEKLGAIRVEQQAGVVALRDASQLSRERYDIGLSSYLEILIADQQLFERELDLARTRGDQMRALAQLYRALGGGWQPEPPTAPPPTTPTTPTTP